MVAQTPKLMLGETCLDDYVSKPIDLNGARKKELDELIQQLESDTFSNEQLPLKLLKIQKAQYPILNLDFLSMHNFTNYKGHKIQVPKFSVYKKTEEGFDDFSINIYADKEYRYVEGIFGGEKAIPTNFYELHIKIDGNLAEIFGKPLLMALSPPNSEEKYLRTFMSSRTLRISKEIGKRYPAPTNNCLTSQFNGIFPQLTKGRLKKAEPIFERQLYLIAETKPEAWAIKKRIVKDPLLVGVFEDKCFLIDHFNTTPIEHYVKSEFTQ